MARSTKSYEERMLQLEKKEQESLEKAKQYAAQKRCRERSGRYHFLLGKMLPAGNQSRIRQKGGNGSWRFFIIQ